MLPLLHFISLEEVTTGEMYEFAHNTIDPIWDHWSPASLYLGAKPYEMGQLASDIAQIIPAFSFYGPNLITKEQWQAIQKIHCYHSPENVPFFEQLLTWLGDDSQFYILGI